MTRQQAINYCLDSAAACRHGEVVVLSKEQATEISELLKQPYSPQRHAIALKLPILWHPYPEDTPPKDAQLITIACDGYLSHTEPWEDLSRILWWALYPDIPEELKPCQTPSSSQPTSPSPTRNS